ncbi:MAG: efflux RND transporter permease subunit, partial [Terriglobia bacterium]
MTTVAAFMGTLPIALAYGAGGRARQPLGVAVVGGLLISQVITLYITPVYYTYLDSFSKFITRLFGGGKREEVGEPGQLVLAGGSNGAAQPEPAGRI